jgi:hypothetical protein
MSVNRFEASTVWTVCVNCLYGLLFAVHNEIMRLNLESTQYSLTFWQGNNELNKPWNRLSCNGACTQSITRSAFQWARHALNCVGVGLANHVAKWRREFSHVVGLLNNETGLNKQLSSRYFLKLPNFPFYLTLLILKILKYAYEITFLSVYVFLCGC